LSAGERSEVQRRLAADASLAADFEQLRLIHDDIVGGLDQLDAVDLLPVEPAVAVKRVGDVLRQRLSVPAARRARAAAAPVPYDIPRRIVGWAAVAAAVAVAATVVPHVMDVLRSNPGGRNPGGTSQVVRTDYGLEMDINRLALGKWAHPDEDPIENLAAAIADDNPTDDLAPGDARVEIDGGPALGEGPIFDIPIDLPERA
jgi:hypothetical protein